MQTIDAGKSESESRGSAGARLRKAVQVLQPRRAKLLGSLRARGFSAPDADDVLQETIIKCAEDAAFDPERADATGYVAGLLKGKVGRVARHQRTQVWRQARREVTADLIETLDTGAPAVEPPNLVERAAVASALDRLSPSDRDLLWQIVVDDTPAVEIARAEGVKAATIRQRFHRALERARAGWECVVGAEAA